MKNPLSPLSTRFRRLFARAADDAGWTFIEIIVVLAIILILSGTVGIMAFRFIGQAKVTSAKNQIQNYSLALNSYALDNNGYPSPEQGLGALYAKPSGEPEAKNWRGPYVEKVPDADPWGNAYQYQVPGPDGLPFGLVSLGADGAEGGEGDNADITSWE
jgi:general secretion pathway protein G